MAWLPPFSGSQTRSKHSVSKVRTPDFPVCSMLVPLGSINMDQHDRHQLAFSIKAVIQNISMVWIMVTSVKKRKQNSRFVSAMHTHVHKYSCILVFTTNACASTLKKVTFSWVISPVWKVGSKYNVSYESK